MSQVARPQYGKEYNQEGQLVDVCIDTEIADLVDSLNAAGYPTCDSCSGLNLDHADGHLIIGDGVCYGYLSFFAKLSAVQVTKIKKAAKSFRVVENERLTIYIPGVSREAILAERKRRGYKDYRNGLPDAKIKKLWNKFNAAMLID